LPFTFLDTGGSDTEHFKAALDKARVALESIRRFQVRIEDRAKSAKISERANGLEAALNELLPYLAPEKLIDRMICST
jgi:hypothetical protein